MKEYNTGWAARAAQDPNDEILKSGVNPVSLHSVLQSVTQSQTVFEYKST